MKTLFCLSLVLASSVWGATQIDSRTWEVKADLRFTIPEYYVSPEGYDLEALRRNAPELASGTLTVSKNRYFRGFRWLERIAPTYSATLLYPNLTTLSLNDLSGDLGRYVFKYHTLSLGEESTPALLHRLYVEVSLQNRSYPGSEPLADYEAYPTWVVTEAVGHYVPVNDLGAVVKIPMVQAARMRRLAKDKCWESILKAD